MTSLVSRGTSTAAEQHTRTHIELVKESVEVRFACRNFLFVASGMEKSRDPTAPASFDDLLYFYDSPAVWVTASRGADGTRVSLIQPTSLVSLWRRIQTC